MTAEDHEQGFTGWARGRLKLLHHFPYGGTRSKGEMAPKTASEENWFNGNFYF